ncbi:uncharacterized protein LOC131241444 [Magnolia sinica]|uniref:uncharacterized protein LOC131241444 n=1 Tax=Magnolia sinica TaxID=86752 RepID=UPI002657F135|nr:uncharacterized protein LOC131241444 [Magnolia sinica]
MEISSSSLETADQPSGTELETLMKAIQDIPNEAFDQALNIFLALKDIKFNQPVLRLQKDVYVSFPENSLDPVLFQIRKDAFVLVRELVNEQLKKICYPPRSELKMAIRVLGMLFQEAPSISVLFGEDQRQIHQLLSQLLVLYDSLQPDEQEYVVPMILDISIHSNTSNKMVGKSPDAIALLIKALGTGSTDSRRHAAKAILNSNKAMLIESGVMEALVKNGVVQVILNMITEEKLAEEMLGLLEMLSANQEALHEINRAVPLLLQKIKCRRTH